MQHRFPTRLAQVTMAGAIIAALGGAGLTSASAADSVSSGCTGVAVTRGDAVATKAAIAQLTQCLQGLTKVADASGHAAQQADETYLRSMEAAQAAARGLARAQARAESAAALARSTRTQAGAVAVQLARGGSAEQAGNLMLEGRGATQTLYGLSRMLQLTAESHEISQRAAQDSAAASRLTAAADRQAQQLRRAAATANAAYLSAKHEADAAAALVRSQRSRVRQLEAQLADLQGPSTRSTAAPSSSRGTSSLPPNASKAARAVGFARAQIGDPYVFAAAGPNAWDCSGLTMGAYGSVGVNIGIHSATAQYNYASSQGRLVPYADRQPGDLIFYTDGGGDMYHEAIYSGNGMMIEAPYEGVNVREVPVRSYQLVGDVARPTA